MYLCQIRIHRDTHPGYTRATETVRFDRLLCGVGSSHGQGQPAFWKRVWRAFFLLEFLKGWSDRRGPIEGVRSKGPIAPRHVACCEVRTYCRFRLRSTPFCSIPVSRMPLACWQPRVSKHSCAGSKNASRSLQTSHVGTHCSKESLPILCFNGDGHH